jgi:DNA-binding CsgD family transcriptional regulator
MSDVAINVTEFITPDTANFYSPQTESINLAGFAFEEQPPAFKYICRSRMQSKRNLFLAHRILVELTMLGLSGKQIAKQSGISRKTITSLLKKTRQRINSNTFQSIINFYLMFHYATLCHDENDLENLALINRAMTLG